MPVSDQHDEYVESIPLWNQVKDCVKGSAAVKSRMSGSLKGDAYLPVPDPLDTSDENVSRFAAYLYRANFVNFTGHTKKGMIGMVFRRDTKIEFPAELEYLKTNSNGGGLSIDQLIKAILGGTLEAGRFGLLVDYPAISDEEREKLTVEQVKELNLQANIQPYAADQIINWRTTVVGAVKKLSLVVIKEKVEEIAEDGFGVKKVTKHRVLKLVDGVYIQELWDDADTMEKTFTPRKSDGSEWNEIPFIFVGSENNDETVDESPLFDLSAINLAHYRNSADYEESSFFVGQPTPVVIGIDENWYTKVLKKKLKLGSRSGIPLPAGGDAKLLQAEANTMPAEGMTAKEQQMIKIGARVIQDISGDETAEAAKIRFAGQNSQLAGIIGNIEDALNSCFVWAGEFMATVKETTLEINRQFYDATMDAQQAMAIIQFADRGDMSQADVRDSLRRSGWISSSKTDEEIDDELDDLNLNLTDDDEKGLKTEATDPALLKILENIVKALNPDQ